MIFSQNKPNRKIGGGGARLFAVRWLVPSPPDSLFLALMVWLFMAGSGWQVLLADGDTGWHIRTGEYILDQGRVPTRDLYSFSRPGETWYAWEWLSDVIFALVHRAMGLKGVVLLAGVALSLAIAISLRHSLERKANAGVALGVTLLAAGASTVHFLARPHVFTMLLVPLSLWLLDRDSRRPGGAVWILVPLSALWSNLHGGFLVLLVFLGVRTVASALEDWRTRETGGAWNAARRYAALTGLCALATLANPFGWRLHQHIAAYLNSSWIREAVEEFQSPQFRSESMTQFEALLFVSLLATARLARRGEWFGALLIPLWAHAALSSTRHVPIFVLSAAPLVASELSVLWEKASAGWGWESLAGILRDAVRDYSVRPIHHSLWPPVLVVSLILLNPPGWWPADFPETKFPVHLVERWRELFRGPEISRILAPDQWGDYLIYRFPERKVFIDGRSDFYGPGLGREYLRLSNAHFEWAALMARHRFDAALIPPAWPLAEILKRDRNWLLVDDDGRALLFVRRRAEPALNKNQLSTERISGGRDG